MFFYQICTHKIVLDNADEQTLYLNPYSYVKTNTKLNYRSIRSRDPLDDSFLFYSRDGF